MSERVRIGEAVRRIAWGYIFIHVHFNLGTIDVLADWIGYAMIVAAISVLAPREESLSKLKGLGIILTVWNAIAWFLKMIGENMNLYLLQIVVIAADIYFHFRLLTGVAAVAEQYDCPKWETLKNLAVARAVLIVIANVAALTSEALAFFMIIIVLIFVIWLCNVLFKTGKLLIEGDGSEPM